MSRTIIISLPRAVARICIALMVLMLVTNTHPLAQDKSQPLQVKPRRSVVRSQHAMVASSQPLASQVGLEVLKRGGNAVDAAIAMAAMLNVTEPMMTGIGGDAFMLVYWSKTKELKGLNASGRAPNALSLDYFAKRKATKMPEFGMESITVPGAFDGWVTLLEKYGTIKLADLLEPAIDCAENGFPVMEKTAEDWNAEVTKLKKTPAAAANYLIEGRAPRPGEIFRQPNLARTLRTLARGGRDAFYKGEIAKAIVDYCEKNGGFNQRVIVANRLFT
jgi:gamma-glutamyltranspeptidase/glutathione hydrolase